MPFADAGVGAIVTQSSMAPTHLPLGLHLMRAGRSAHDTLSALLLIDEDSPGRQAAMVDASGEVAAHTGECCIQEAGHYIGDGYSTQANMMLRDTVPRAMAEAFESAPGDLTPRLLAALEAAEEQLGDIRGKQSAAIVIVSGTDGGRPWVDKQIDLRVDDHPEPLVELRRLAELKHAYNLQEKIIDLTSRLVAGEFVESAQLNALLADAIAAERKADGNVEFAFWRGVTLAAAGRENEAKMALQPALGEHPGWAELLRRLPAAGRLQDDSGLIKRLLSKD